MRTTLMLAISGFTNPESDDSKGLITIKPNDVTRVAFNKKGYGQIQISDELGPQSGTMLELIDADYFAADEIDASDYDRALIVRLEATDALNDVAIQAIGDSVESYMNQHGCTEFATAAVADIGEGKNLFGRWNTVVLTRDYDGKWIGKILGFASVKKSTHNTYAMLLDGKLAKVPATNIISTVLDDEKLAAAFDTGNPISTKKAHLVRAPINQGGAFAVVTGNLQTVYNDEMKVIAAGQTGFLVMPAINEDGTPIDGQVTTVSGSGNAWDVRKSISAAKADNLGPAYGATPAAS